MIYYLTGQSQAFPISSMPTHSPSTPLAGAGPQHAAFGVIHDVQKTMVTCGGYKGSLTKWGAQDNSGSEGPGSIRCIPTWLSAPCASDVI